MTTHCWADMSQFAKQITILQDEAHMGEILALAQSATEPGWGTRYGDAVSERFAAYVALEDEANAAP